MQSALAQIRSQIERKVPGALRDFSPISVDVLPTRLTVFKNLSGGIPRSALTQLVTLPGASAGRSALLLGLLAEATAREEFCALIDAADHFDPASGQGAGVDLRRLLWVRCSGPNFKAMEQSFKAIDIVAQNGGFGLIAADLSWLPETVLRKVPMTTWFRLSRVLEKASTALLLLVSFPAAQSCAGLTLHLQGRAAASSGSPLSQSCVLESLSSRADVGRARARKAVQSASSQEFTLWRWA